MYITNTYCPMQNIAFPIIIFSSDKADTSEDEANGNVVAISRGKFDGRTATSIKFKHEEFINFGS